MEKQQSVLQHNPDPRFAFAEQTEFMNKRFLSAACFRPHQALCDFIPLLVIFLFVSPSPAGPADVSAFSRLAAGVQTRASTQRGFFKQRLM